MAGNPRKTSKLGVKSFGKRTKKAPAQKKPAPTKRSNSRLGVKAHGKRTKPGGKPNPKSRVKAPKTTTSVKTGAARGALGTAAGRLGLAGIATQVIPAVAGLLQKKGSTRGQIENTKKARSKSGHMVMSARSEAAIKAAPRQAPKPLNKNEAGTKSSTKTNITGPGTPKPAQKAPSSSKSKRKRAEAIGKNVQLKQRRKNKATAAKKQKKSVVPVSQRGFDTGIGRHRLTNK